MGKNHITFCRFDGNRLAMELSYERSEGGYSDRIRKESVSFSIGLGEPVQTVLEEINRRDGYALKLLDNDLKFAQQYADPKAPLTQEQLRVVSYTREEIGKIINVPVRLDG